MQGWSVGAAVCIGVLKSEVKKKNAITLEDLF